MGGKIFSSNDFNLNTPRMPPSVYFELRDRLLTLLRSAHFDGNERKNERGKRSILKAECPIEAPAKLDYGDIDILLLVDGDRLEGEEFAKVVGAKAWKMSGKAMIHFAVPWPEQIKQGLAIVTTTTADGADASKVPNGRHLKQDMMEITNAPHSRQGGGGDTPTALATSISIKKDSIAAGREEEKSQEDDKFIQIDIIVCPASTPNSFTWTHFHISHGDLWNMLGRLIRPRGLTITDTGFYIRIREIETRNKSAARVLLTADPGTTLRFLGLDEERYWRPFDSLEDMFGYVSTCRFFHPAGNPDPDRERERQREYQHDTVADEKTTEPIPADNEADKLKASDRARLKKRPVFRLWVEEHLPRHAHDEPVDPHAANMSRSEVLDEAKRFFGKGFADLYETRRRDAMVEMRRQAVYLAVRKRDLGIPRDKVGLVIRALKGKSGVDDPLFGRWMDILEGDNIGHHSSPTSGSDQRKGGLIVDGENDDDDDDGDQESKAEAAIVQWVTENWSQIAERQLDLETRKRDQR